MPISRKSGSVRLPEVGSKALKAKGACRSLVQTNVDPAVGVAWLEYE